MDNPESVWGVLELMGHVRLAGRILEEEKFGSKLGRIDVPLNDGSTVTQYFGASSVYRLTIVSEEVARSVAKSLIQPVPVSAWELPKQLDATAAKLEPVAPIDPPENWDEPDWRDQEPETTIDPPIEQVDNEAAKIVAVISRDGFTHSYRIPLAEASDPATLRLAIQSEMEKISGLYVSLFNCDGTPDESFKIELQEDIPF